MDADLIVSIDGSALPGPVTELDLPPEPTVEDNLWMLEPVADDYTLDSVTYDRVYRGYYETYKFLRPITVRFKYRRPSKYVFFFFFFFFD